MVSKFEIHPKDIVLADPQYQDQSENKRRPLLVISKSLFHQYTGFFVCTGITTNQTNDPYLLPITSKDTVDILKEKSQVMCKRIVTVRQDVIVKK
ncbi:type II toxin-antitoxin system PemK/MazF family toxin [Candidatus Nitrosotenuis aquarius]|uniref:type II toxin-antitoxin system PemK/MazF family toxin n=1 Tax=Candidatus Nitrosotenuis aquarius TaxID=1846278 RepID=UPI000C1F37F0